MTDRESRARAARLGWQRRQLRERRALIAAAALASMSPLARSNLSRAVLSDPAHAGRWIAGLIAEQLRRRGEEAF